MKWNTLSFLLEGIRLLKKLNVILDAIVMKVTLIKGNIFVPYTIRSIKRRIVIGLLQLFNFFTISIHSLTNSSDRNLKF